MKKYILPGTILAAVLVLLLLFLPRGGKEEAEVAPTLVPEETAAPIPETTPETVMQEEALETSAPRETVSPSPTEETEAPVSKDQNGGGRSGGKTRQSAPETSSPTQKPTQTPAPTATPSPSDRKTLEISINLIQKSNFTPVEDTTDQETYELPEVELK